MRPHDASATRIVRPLLACAPVFFDRNAPTGGGSVLQSSALDRAVRRRSVFAIVTAWLRGARDARAIALAKLIGDCRDRVIGAKIASLLRRRFESADVNAHGEVAASTPEGPRGHCFRRSGGTVAQRAVLAAAEKPD